MTGGMLGFVLCAVLIPLVVNEAGDLVPSLARCLLRWGARRLGHADQAERYEEEWLADLERIPGKLTKLGHACGILAWSVPRLRAQFRQPPHRELLSGLLSGRMMHRVGKQLAISPEISATLQQVAETLVPQFADHCLIDLFQGDMLIRRLQRNTGGWTPPPGTWARTGEQVRYPEGHFCQQAMARRDTILVGNLAEEDLPAPSARSAAVSYAVGMTSIVTAPLQARGVLFGVMSVALSGLTDRSGRRFTTADQDFIGALARRVAAAIDSATQLEAQRQTVLASRIPWPRRDPRAFLACESRR